MLLVEISNHSAMSLAWSPEPEAPTISVNGRSLDCTILVRSVPHRGWVRRLLGHHAGIRCLLFYGTRYDDLVLYRIL